MALSPEAARRKKAKRKRRNRKLVELAKDRPCQDCGVTYPPRVMDLHHRHPDTKLFSLGQVRSRSVTQVIAEIAKCDVLCANCHRLRH